MIRLYPGPATSPRELRLFTLGSAWGALGRLTGSKALSQVMRGTTYRPEMLQAMDRWSEQGALAAQIVAKTPVWRLRRPKDYSALGKVCAATEAL